MIKQIAFTPVQPPGELMLKASTDNEKKLIEHFNRPVVGELKDTDIARIVDGRVLLPVSTSLFLINSMAEADKNARKLNALQQYVNDLLHSLQQVKQIKLH